MNMFNRISNKIQTNPYIMRLAKGYQATYLYIILSVIMVVIMVMVVIKNNDKQNLTKTVERTHEILDVTHSVTEKALEIETSIRGFVLLRDESMLPLFYQGTSGLRSEIETLEKLEKNDAKISKTIASLHDIANDRIRNVELFVLKLKSKQISNDEVRAATEKGKELSTRVKTLANEINNYELKQLTKDKAADESNDSDLNVNIILLTMVVGIIVLLGFLILTIQNSKNKLAAEVEKSNTLFSNIFSHNPACISITRQKDGVLIRVNESYLKLFDFKTSEEVIGKTSNDINIYVKSTEEKELYDQLVKENNVKNKEIEVKTRYGEIKWISSSVLILEIEGEPCILNVSIDITEQKKAEEKLLESNREMEAFTYTVSHDLRAPLRAINGYANIIIEEYEDKLDDEGAVFLNSIVGNSRKMGDLIDDLLAFSRLGRNVMPTSEINMKGLLQTVIDERIQTEDDKVFLTIKEIYPATGQQALIKQVWINFVSNALKYSQHSPIQKIEIGSYYRDNNIVYYIKDNGVGFDMKYYNKLFGVFQRLHTKEEFEGTGIGLAIVQKIISKHNGTVWAESELGVGSTFFFSLPRLT